MQSGRLIAVDGTALMHRALRGARPLERSDGVITGSAVSFCQVLLSLHRRLRATHAAVAFDGPRRSFRIHLTSSYKVNRERHEWTDSQIEQIRMMRYGAAAFGYKVIDSAPYEADDVLATLSHTFQGRVFVVSPDKDMHQLVSDRVSVYDWKRDAVITPDSITKRWGVAPDKVSDVQAAAGDGVDGVSGIRGVGLKGAAAVISQYGSFDNFVASALDTKHAVAVAERFRHAIACRDVTRLVRDANVDFGDLSVPSNWPRRAVSFLKALEANAAADRVCREMRLQSRSIPPDAKWATSVTSDHKRRTLFS